MQENVKIDLNDAQGFCAWLRTVKGLSEKWARNTAWYVNRLLIRENIPFPEKEDAEALAFKILRSELSKSHKRNTLKAIEHYMEYVGKPVHFKKPTKGKSPTRYLAHDELKKTVRTSSNYSEFPMLTASYTTGMRLNEVRMLDIGNLDFSRKTMTVRCGRLSGDREVSVNLDREKVLKVYLEKYLDKTRMLPNVPLFEGNRGNRIRTSENT